MAKILIVDDDVEILSMVSKILESEKHTVECVENGQIALAMLQEFQPDLLITDIIMPDKEGLELIRENRDLNTNIKVIAMSGGSRISPEHYLSMAKMFGADITLEKPFSRASLIEAVDNLIS